MKKYFLLLLLFSILFVSCSNKDNTIEEEYIPIPYSLKVPWDKKGEQYQYKIYGKPHTLSFELAKIAR